jgi:hypothetical protein
VFGLSLTTACLVAPNVRAAVTLRWEAPPECPARDEVLARIRALTGTSLEKTTELFVDGRIERVAGRFSLTLLVRDDREVRTRVIRSDACADLAGAAAVTLALLLGIDVDAAGYGADTGEPSGPASGADAPENPAPKAGADASGDERAAPRANLPPKSGAPSDDRKSGTTPPGTQTVRILLRIPVASVDFGPLPKPSLGLGLGLGARYESVRVVLTGRVSQRQRISAPAPYTASGAELDRVTLELSGCYGFRSQVFEVAPCAALGLERVNARGFGEDLSPQSARAAWPSLGAGAVAHAYAWESLAIFAAVTGSAQLSSPKVVIEGLGELVELEILAAGVAIGAEWIF